MGVILSTGLLLGSFSFPQVTGLLTLVVSLGVIGFLVLPRLVSVLGERLYPSTIKNFHGGLFESDLPLIRILFGLIIADIVLLLFQSIAAIAILELPFSLVIFAITSYLGIRVIKKFYTQNIEKSVNLGQKLDIDFFFVSQNLIILAFLFVVITIFAGTHDINIFALLASLGIGGVAVAFAAQKVLEQYIGGIVLYFDSPFSIDDYIKTADGTFGRVESMGLRVTKIRTSGKGTVVSIPNNLLVQENIENFTSAGRLMAIINLKFPQGISLEEQTLIRQVIMAGFQAISGIDSNSVTLNFSTLELSNVMRCQISFCIFSSPNELSMDLRREVIQAAGDKIQQQLQDFSIYYEMEATLNSVSLPISI